MGWNFYRGTGRIACFKRHVEPLASGQGHLLVEPTSNMRKRSGIVFTQHHRAIRSIFTSERIGMERITGLTGACFVPRFPHQWCSRQAFAPCGWNWTYRQVDETIRRRAVISSTRIEYVPPGHHRLVSFIVREETVEVATRRGRSLQVM